MKLVTGILSLVLSLPALAQEMEYVPSQSGKWQTTVNEERLPPYKLNPEEQQLLLKKATNVINLVKTFPEFNPPVGFEIHSITGLKYVYDEQHFNLAAPLPLELNMEMGNYYKKGNEVKYNADPEMLTILQFHFNDPDAITRSHEIYYEKVFDQKGNQLIFEPKVLGVFGKATVYDNGSLIFSQPGKKVWIPVTVNEYMESLLFFYGEKIKNGEPIQMVYDMIKKEMDALTAAELAMPAYYDDLSEKLSKVTTEKREDTKAVVMFNPSYFDKTKPRTALQLLVIDFYFAANYNFEEPIEATPENITTGSNRVHLYSFVNKFDFSKLQSFIE